MKQFKNKRNVVTLNVTTSTITKTFHHIKDFQNEIEMYNTISKTYLPIIQSVKDQQIEISYLPFPTYLEILEYQEETHFDQTPWLKLMSYLDYLNKDIHKFPTDVNLRNFLYDEKNQQLYAIDFEQYADISLETCLNKLVAFIDLYDPMNTDSKQQIHALFLLKYHLDESGINLEKESILKRRGNLY